MAASRPRTPGLLASLSIVVFICSIASTASSFCTPPHPADYSHRHESAKSWLSHRSKNRTLGNWGLGSWSNYKKLNIFPANTTDAAMQEFIEWSTKLGVSPGTISVRDVETPWCPAEGGQGDKICRLSSYAARRIEGGEKIMDISVRASISDVVGAEDPRSMEGAPWEVRLATKLLRERAKGDASEWAPFIKLLPGYIPLPLFFSNLELNNVEDWYVVEEVQLMRKFAQSVYQVLHEDEIPRVNFNAFVWALSVVYSSACTIEVTRETPVYHLLPFFSSKNTERSSKALSFEQLSERLVLASKESINQGVPLLLASVSRSTAVELVYSGEVLEKNVHNKFPLFRDLMELVEWYLATYSSISCNRYLMLTVVQQVVKAISFELMQLNVTADELRADFSVHSDGYINSHMLCIFATLSSLKGLFDPSSQIETDWDGAPLGDLEWTQATAWESKITELATECIRISKRRIRDCRSAETPFRYPVSFALKAIEERLRFLLDSFPTSLEEDNLMLMAAAWEGYAKIGTSLACPTCRWQIEQLSQNDYMAVKFRSVKKALFLDMISWLSCSSSDAVHSKRTPAIAAQVQHADIQKFLDWCAVHKFSISNKLTIMEINVEGKREGVTDDNKQVRSVVVVEDISHGETLSSLPLHMGLFDKDSMHILDGWDHAAACLLRERALGNGSKWAPYIDILPSRVPTPINLETQELKEVQWWPVLRELIQVRKSIKESYFDFDDEAAAGATLDEFRWAVTIVHSRAFTLPVIDDEKYAPYVLMPFMDMINHHHNYQADWTSEPVWNGKLEIIAKRRLKKGEQLFASFGPRTNDNLFMYYGFVLEDNPWDTAPIFSSFEASVRWFFQLWRTNCSRDELAPRDVSASGTCDPQWWELIWQKVTQALDNVDNGASQHNKEWIDLANQWGEFGFQFLPYNPSPAIYAKGVIDPSLMETLATVADFVLLPKTANPSSYSTLRQDAMKTYFGCLGSHKPSKSVAEWKGCIDNLVTALSLATERKVSYWIAEISIATRCFQVLQSLPTSIDEDRSILESNCQSSLDTNCRGSRTGMNASLLQLTTRYRLMKKMLLQATIDRLLRATD